MKWFVFYTSRYSWGMEQFDSIADAEQFMDDYATQKEDARFKVILGSFENVTNGGDELNPDWRIK